MRMTQKLLVALAIAGAGAGAWSDQAAAGRPASLPRVEKPQPAGEQRIAPALQEILSAGRKLDDPARLSNHFARVNGKGEVQVYVRVKSVTDALRRELAAAGLRLEIINKELRTVQAWGAPDAIEKAAALPQVQQVALPSYGRFRAGAAMTQGDAILLSNYVRRRGVDGSGVTVGVISDGVTHRAAAQATGDLPPTIDIDPAQPGNGDAGTALLEIVHDIAPGANLAFSGVTQNATTLNFIRAVDYLQNVAKCDIIFDDIGFYQEPVFEDGPIAMRVRQATNAGILYVSAAGNDGQGHYQGVYADANPEVHGGWPHDLHAFVGGDITMRIVLPPQTDMYAVLQWGDAFGASGNDYDLFLYDDFLTTAITWSNARQDGNDNPYEALYYYNRGSTPLVANLVVNRAAGETRLLNLFVWGPSVVEHSSPVSSIFGHPALPSVLCVSAVHAHDPGYDTISASSSQGPSVIIYPTPEIRSKPCVVAIDGVSVTGAGGFPNPYFGTSAAAAHAAGVAALLLSSNPTLTARRLHDRLESTALDLGDPGVDIVFGHGRIRAIEAVTMAGVKRWSLYR